MKHLTDFEIQGHIDQPAKGEVSMHLQTCADCRARVELYQKLFHKIERTPFHDEVTFDIASHVLPRVMVKRKQRQFVDDIFVWIMFVIVFTSASWITVKFSLLDSVGESVSINKFEIITFGIIGVFIFMIHMSEIALTKKRQEGKWGLSVKNSEPAARQDSNS